jgi:hypothetical protein
LAQSVTSLRRTSLVAIGGKADIGRSYCLLDPDAIDLGCVKTLEAFVGAQQKNRTCGLSESFMRGRHPVRIYLLPERPAKRFSRSQDPSATSAGSEFLGTAEGFASGAATSCMLRCRQQGLL